MQNKNILERMELMNQNQIKRFIQQQYDAGCRSYKSYYKTYEQVIETWEEIADKREMLEKRRDAKKAISDLQEFIESEEFKDGIEILDNPKKLIEFATEITNCENQKIDSTEEQQELKQIEETMEEYRKTIRSLQDIMKQIRKNIFSTITRASELNITLDCSSVDLFRTRYKLFVLYFSDNYMFEHCRNVIGEAYFPKKFMGAYSEKENLEEAYEWFLEEAKGMEF